MSTDPNTLIATAMATDPEWKEWATVPCEHWVEQTDSDTGAILGEQRKPEDCPHCRGTGRIPRDFADGTNTLKLLRWAMAQPWWLEGEGGFGGIVNTEFDVAVAWDEFLADTIDDEEFAVRVRDIIAARLKEIHDGTP